MSTEIGSWALQPPAAPIHRSRPPTACDRHPNEPVIGFCASCLRERLAGLEAAAEAASAAAADVPRKSTSSALKSVFSRSSGVQASNANFNLRSSSYGRPELRRSKSFSVSRIPGFAAACEPQRKSCDVRARNTLLSLFHQDDEDRPEVDIVEECPNFPVPDVEGREDSDEIMSATDEMDEDTETPAVDLKPIKDHIVFDSQAKKISPKDAKEFAGSFWLAASVFSKKLQEWRRKQKLKKKPPSEMQLEKAGNSSQRVCDTQSEIAIDAFGRRSCDINPRFSLDATRFSFDDPRHSWDEPRASWDGYLIGGSGGRSLLPRLPPMLAVAEDFPVPAVQRFDGLIPVEEDLAVPGGSSQTRDYYEGSHSRGRKSLERSNSTQKQSFEMKLSIPAANSNVKGSPTVSAELVQTYHAGKHERDSREWSSNSLRDECSENIDISFRHQSKVPPAKKSRRWSKAWSFLGFINRRGGTSNTRGNGVETSFSETWPELGTDMYNRKICRSNSTVSSRSSFNGHGGFGSSRRNGVESNGNRKKKKKREEFVLERNPSSRYSPRHVDNGLLRFYLPAMKGSRRRKKYSSTHSLTGSMLRLY
ncbi:protein OCTOPUS-like [Dendrobium catenatum]|uniref:UPF0503 protein n=1 Tax=Dendrobium catenatum TaxID=906689 RepID=A0A2I0WN82_9ASPA|nr:protein OCTOPUS-like [Dendrobium catenatum]PKU77119.1 UPF0503 protein [Dendrobium catenatum]